MNFQIRSNSEEDFQKIAEELINHHILKVNETEIRFCDLEFYWNDGANHQDKSTHPHNYENGQLRPHSSGFDIALKNENGYGGILIRGIIVEEEAVYGPLNSAKRMLQFGAPLTAGLHISLHEKRPAETCEIFETTRIGLGKNAGDFAERNYRFIKCDPDYLTQIPRKEKFTIQLFEKNKLSYQEAGKVINWKSSKLENAKLKKE